MTGTDPRPLHRQDPPEIRPSSPIAAVVRNGVDLIAIVRARHCVLDDLGKLLKWGRHDSEAPPLSVLARAALDPSIPLALMPCSYVSGMTAALLHGEPGYAVTPIKGKPELCVQDGVLHLRSLAVGPVELPGIDPNP